MSNAHISSLQTRIAQLEARLASAEAGIAAQNLRLSTAESDIACKASLSYVASAIAADGR